MSSESLGMFFLDSGAHSLYNIHVLNKKVSLARVREEEYTYYETQGFWDYVDAYANFVKKYQKYMDFFANVDVIYNAKKSYEVQCYLEEQHGLKPVPVIHYGCEVSWIDKYLKRGHTLLGIGGLGQGATKQPYKKWADRIFSHICPGPTHLPIVRTHGFAMTGFDLMLRYPWWSVDSASWTKIGAFGGILVPHYRGDQFIFNKQPYIISISIDSPNSKFNGKHYTTLNKSEKKIIKRWLEFINVPLGRNDASGEVVEYGVTNRHSERKIANLLFFEELRKSLPAYPWPFRPTRRKGFALT